MSRGACATLTPRSPTRRTASILNSPLNLRLCIPRLPPPETPYLGVHGTGSRPAIDLAQEVVFRDMTLKVEAIEQRLLHHPPLAHHSVSPRFAMKSESAARHRRKRLLQQNRPEAGLRDWPQEARPCFSRWRMASSPARTALAGGGELWVTIGVVSVMHQPCSTLTPIGVNSSTSSRGRAEPATSIRLRCVRRSFELRRCASSPSHMVGTPAVIVTRSLSSICGEKRRRDAGPAESAPPPPSLRNRATPTRRRDTSTRPAICDRPSECRTSRRNCQRRCAASSRGGCRARPSAGPWCPRCSKARSPCFHRTPAKKSPRPLRPTASHNNRGVCPAQVRHLSCRARRSGARQREHRNSPPARSR